MMGNINNIMSDDSSELSDYKNSDNIVIEIDNYDTEKESIINYDPISISVAYHF